MKTTHKLPEWLGGHEVELKEDTMGKDGFCRVRTLIDGHEIWVDLDGFLLTKIGPPEPGDGTDWIAGDVVFSRRDNWKSTNQEYRWYSTDGGGTFTWAEVVREARGRGPLIELAPDPADSAPELPFAVEDGYGNRIVVDPRDRKPGVHIFFPGDDDDEVHLDPKGAEIFALAILRAAREARAAK